MYIYRTFDSRNTWNAREGGKREREREAEGERRRACVSHYTSVGVMYGRAHAGDYTLSRLFCDCREEREREREIPKRT